jgi:hypothetical protein
MLEREGVLLTWRLRTLPPAWQSGGAAGESDEAISIAAEPLADHRIEYLDYQGPVSGDRGHVRRLDNGNYAVLKELGDCLQARLEGRRVRAIVSLPIAPPLPVLE